jgi:hypothetical protein
VLPSGEVAHALSHTYAEGLVARGVALPVVQQLLGHKDLKTTSVHALRNNRLGLWFDRICVRVCLRATQRPDMYVPSRRLSVVNIVRPRC